MGTKTASGVAPAGVNTAEGAIAATRQALHALGGDQPLVGLLFASPSHALDLAIAAARGLCPGTAFAGCTTAGEITERGLTHGGMSVMLIASDDLVVDVEIATGISVDFDFAARQLCDHFAETVASARKRGFVDSTTIMLIDGLSGVGEKLVSQIIKKTRNYQQVVGGAAGDEGTFKATWVGAGEAASTDSAAALHVFGPTPWGVGVDHGLSPSTPKMVVTRARANVVYEIDGHPAFDVYKKYASERGVTLTRDNAGPFLINNELGVYFLNHLQRARAPLAVGADGSLICAADIDEGSSVSILSGKRENLVAAARNAAREAREALKGARAAGVLLFDCICRGTILDSEFGREIEAVRDVFPGVPICGFLTYGEIARYKGRLDGWHNTTAVVTAIPSLV
jgi:hypothetical protein